MLPELKFCANCVMDGTDPNITFDAQGVCNHCHSAQRMLQETKENKTAWFDLIQRIRKDGLDNDYNVLIGLSGGVDSSMVLHHAVARGLRPLCFSVDNGYNDPKADENIMRMVEKLKVPFERRILNLPQFKILQTAFIRAGLKNLEIPTDHVLMAMTYQVAEEYGIKWVLSGGNVATESIMPSDWGYNARDLRHIQSVYKWAFGEKLTGLPLCGLLKFNYYKWVKGIDFVYLLDYTDYNRAESVKLLGEKYGWQDYHEKHCENIFTWWFQNFYLFEKFGIDKRKAHYSSLINSGQMTRQEAMDLLADRPIYPKLGIEEKVMQYPKHSHDDFAKDEKLFNFIGKLVRIWRS